MVYKCAARFLTCVSHTAHVIDIGWTSDCPLVRLSVCPSHAGTRNGLTYRQTVFTACVAHDSSFLWTKHFS